MREIKFRVWAACDDGLKMKYLGKVDCDNGLWFDVDEHIDDYENSIMQFTGLKDKNGKELFEGDIVVFDIAPSELKEIWFDKGAINHWSIFHYQHPFEILGNKFENPELLNQGEGSQRSVATDDQSKGESL